MMPVCELHNMEMGLTDIPLNYGMPSYDPAWAVRDELFPNSHSYALGGCVIGDDDPDHVTALVCGECRKVEKEWRAANEGELDPLPHGPIDR